MRPWPLLLVSLVAAVPAAADSGHDRALAARRAGEIVALDRILATVAAVVPGTVLEVELEERKGRYVYELEILTPDGLLVEVKVDAHDQRILKTETERRKRD